MVSGSNIIKVADVRQRTQWYAFVRLLFLLAIAVPGIFSLIIFEGFSEPVRGTIALTVVAVGGNLLFYGLTKLRASPAYQQTVAAIFIVLDILLVSYFVFTHGGIESRSPILYVVPMLMAGALFGRRGIYLSALTSGGLYMLIIGLDYLNVIHSTGAIDPTLRSNLPYVVNTLCFFPSILLVIALAIDFITKLIFEKQQQITETVESLENAQEIAKLGSWTWDIKKDEIVWSKELYRITGATPSDKKLSYKEYLRLLRPDEANDHSRIVLNALKRKIPFSVEHRMNLPDGSVKYLHGEGRPIRDKSGRVIKMSGTSQDVTELYHLDQAKQEFVSLASHQLRTPASGVKAFLSLLLDGHAGKLNRNQHNFLKQAYDANNKQLDIIDNLLSLASIESGKLTVNKELVDLQESLQLCISAHIHQIREKKQKISFKKLRNKIYVMADQNVLNMALDNLISNASKYSPEKSRISILTRQNKSYVYIDITDNGIGIAKKDLVSLFQKFSRLNDPASKTVGGSGLGLYMAKYVVELHGGKITVRSKHGVGTTFTIKLPISVQKR